MNDFNDTKELHQGASAFNMAIATLMRINALLTAAAEASASRRLEQWFDILLAMKREVSYNFNKDEKAANKKFLEGNNDLKDKDGKYIPNGLNVLDNLYRAYMNRKMLKRFKNYGLYYNLLDKYENFIRRCLDDRKMLTAKAGDPSTGWSQE